MKIVMAQTTGMRMHFIADEGGSMLELYNNPEAELSVNGDIHPLSLHFAFSTDDIEADRQRLIEAGATPVGEINESPVAKLAFLRDPWDLPIQLVRRFTPLV
jgi:hypothetical protein